MNRVLPPLALLLLAPPALAAQTARAPRMDARLIPAPSALAAAGAVEMRRDHIAGAVEGMVIGALVGGASFALVTYIGNYGDYEGEGYALLAIPVGGAVGGALGFVAGAIIGAPDRGDDEDADRAQIVILPDAAGAITAGVSLPIGARPHWYERAGWTRRRTTEPDGARRPACTGDLHGAGDPPESRCAACPSPTRTTISPRLPRACTKALTLP